MPKTCEYDVFNAVAFINKTNILLQILNANQFLAKAGPYLSILATLIGEAICLFTGIRKIPFKTDIDRIVSNQSKYFNQLCEAINQVETDKFVASNLEAERDPVERMKYAQDAALREFKAFLEVNDPSGEFGGLCSITMRDGRWRWVCDSCKEKADHGLSCNFSY